MIHLCNVTEEGLETRMEYIEDTKYLCHIVDEGINTLVYKTPKQIIDYLDMTDCFEYEVFEVVGCKIYHTWERGRGSKYEVVDEQGNVAFWGYGTDH